MKWLVRYSVSQLDNLAASQSISQPVGHLLERPGQSISQPIRKTVNQPVRQLVS